MTISNTTSRWEFTGDGATVGFDYDAKIFASGDLEVYVDGVLQTLTTHYTVSGVGVAGGGTVTFVTAPAAAAEVVIIRKVPATQTNQLPPRGPLPSAAIEAQLDRCVILAQQLAAAVARCIRLPETEKDASSMVVPDLATRLNGFLRFNASTGAVETAATTDTDVSPFMIDVLAAASLAAALSALGLSSDMQAFLQTADDAAAIAALGALADVLTTQGDLLYEGVSGPARLAIGGSGRILGTDGTVPVWRAAATQAEMEAGTEATTRGMSPLLVAQAIAALGAGGTIDVQTFNSSGTWNKPASGALAIIECWGGGGSGGRKASNTGGGGGGGGYSMVVKLLSTLGATEAVTIGAGGAPVSSDANGNTGGGTSFGSHCVAYGGGGGGGNGTYEGGGGGGATGYGVAAGAGGGPDGGAVGSGSVGAGAGFGGGGGGDGGSSPYAGGDGGWGGGGGGGGHSITGGGGGGGASIMGGGGGGGGKNTAGSTGVGGTSRGGGAGGAGGAGSAGTAGTVPGGGGGGAGGAFASGAGAAGQCRVTVI